MPVKRHVCATRRNRCYLTSVGQEIRSLSPMCPEQTEEERFVEKVNTATGILDSFIEGLLLELRLLI